MPIEQPDGFAPTRTNYLGMVSEFPSEIKVTNFTFVPFPNHVNLDQIIELLAAQGYTFPTT